MSDKRSVATDALETLGTSPIPEGSGRDAIHLAVEPCIAGIHLYAGEHIGLKDGKAVTVLASEAVGIVDPFLKEPVEPGEKFWLVVYPRQITSLRHVWEHPAFAKEEKPITEEDRLQAERVAERLLGSHEKWLREWCDNNDGPSYDLLMKAVKNGGEASDYDQDGDGIGIRIDRGYIQVSGTDASGSIPDEFWDHVEKLTGIKQTNRPDHFSCSC